MGPTSVGGCPWLIYALQGKLNNSCELVSCLRQGLYLVSIKWLWKTMNLLLRSSMKYWPLIMHEPDVLGYYDALQRARTVFESVFLASYGGARWPYPHILYPLYENLLYKLAPGVQQGGSGAPVPEAKETCANAGMWGKPAKATMTRGGFLINKQNELAGDRDKRMYFPQWLTPASLPVTPYVPSFK